MLINPEPRDFFRAFDVIRTFKDRSVTVFDAVAEAVGYRHNLLCGPVTVTSTCSGSSAGPDTHLFSPAVQFNTTVMGLRGGSPISVLTRKRWPSRAGT